jgi:hypothetical protein
MDRSNRWPRLLAKTHGRLAGAALLLLAAVTTASCGSSATGKIVAPRAPKLARWTAFAHVQRPLDLVGPRADGSLVLAGAGRLSLLTPTGGVQPLARGPGGYQSPGGEEPYVALSPGGCFGHETVYALRLTSGRGVVAIDASGVVRRLATIGAPGLIDGIAFDRTGRFAHRLLVTVNAGATTTVEAIGCNGVVAAITRNAPRVEGGIAVAPSTFGRFAGDLIAPSETTGKIYAITPGGRSFLVASSGLPHGNDVGVESEAFIPGGRARDALVADRLTPGNPHPGDDVVLRVTGSALRAAGTRPGDLLITTEGGALTDAVSCSGVACVVRFVAQGPAIAHIEGHIVFAAAAGRSAG